MPATLLNAKKAMHARKGPLVQTSLKKIECLQTSLLGGKFVAGRIQ